METTIKQKRRKEKEIIRRYSEQNFFIKLGKFFYYKIKDTIESINNPKEFKEYGLTLYCGKQGAGKTIAMTEYLERMRRKYPKALILTNYGYKNETKAFKDWKDFFEVKNGKDGVIFAIDEIQNEFSSQAWRNFPESLLSEITQQRKQRIKIVATSQVFTRVAKPLREQTFEVVECLTFAGRWTITKAFDAHEYNRVIDTTEGKSNLRRLYMRTFIQDNYLRNLYDTYAKIEKIKNTKYLNRIDRLQ